MYSPLRLMRQWLRGFSARMQPIRNQHRAQVQLEGLESRELMDASTLLVQLAPGAVLGGLAGSNNLRATSLPGLYSVSGDQAALAKLLEQYSKADGVVFAEFDQTVHVALANDDMVHVALTPNDPGYSGGSLWGLDAINAPAGWNSTTGSTKVGVAILDTGIDYSHPD